MRTSSNSGQTTQQPAGQHPSLAQVPYPNQKIEVPSAASHAAQPLTSATTPLGQITRRRSDPAQWVTEIGKKRLKLVFLPLESVTKPNLTTAEAAYYLNRRPQTLRAWAMRDGSGPIRPRRIGGLLAWNTQEIKALAGVQA